ncbi:MAG: HAD family hydrolase [Eubacteriales bacterium]|nr:HAD family hydrolase [Eubacteriales bacterium]
MRPKAIFFDRDGTLTHNDPAGERLRAEKLRLWSGRELDTSDAYFMKMFRKVLQGGFPFAPYHDEAQEAAFFRQWYWFVLEDMGVAEKREERADELAQSLWYQMKIPYPDTVSTLECLRNRGYAMGVISDGPPSLERTLRLCGLHGYFTSFTASSLVGAGKPDPRIFNAALAAQGVTAQESLFVDDTLCEVEGARAQGFCAFWLDRSGTQSGPGVLHSLEELTAIAQ